MLRTKKKSGAPRLRCAHCEVYFPSEELNLQAEAQCRGCGSKQTYYVFPAFARMPTQSGATDTIAAEGDEKCFECSDRKAVTHCDDCGRPVSAFMSVTLGKHRSCLACVQAKRDDQDDPRVEVRRTAEDNRALLLATLPAAGLFTFPVTFFSAPLTLFFAIRGWMHGKRSMLSKGNWKYGVAIVLAVLQIGFWGWWIHDTSTRIQREMMSAISGGMPEADDAWEMDHEGEIEWESDALEQALSEMEASLDNF